jgi:hypothetical protein
LRWPSYGGENERGVELLLHDNAPVHASTASKEAIRKAGFTELPHPAYSPDLTPSDYNLFPNLKKDLKGRKFESIEEGQEAAMQWLRSQRKEFGRAGLVKLRDRWLKCYNTDGDYVEK